ncbi:MAG: hypothetical protein FWH17_06870 [Oscillospiraceae bacterium]|nr:hypothetical protein [Oscillospiraceae bacterium]
MLKSVVLQVKKLSPEQIEAMYKIMEVYYGNTSQNAFIGELRKKQDVVMLLDEQNIIRGFTTLAVFIYDTQTQLLYSGDTIVEKEYWGRHDLSQTWINNAMKYAEKFDGTTYWFLLSKGYKTYKYLNTFFKEYYPRFDTEIPDKIQCIMDTFAERQYGDKYRNGVWLAGNDYLKDEYDFTKETAARDKNTAFFLKKNPGYMNGDELICLCEISVDNLNKLGRRVLGR